MSLKAMIWVMENSDATLGSRLVLLALADNANDEGEDAYPAVETLARKARMSPRAVRSALRRLETDEHIENHGKQEEFGTTIYSIRGMKNLPGGEEVRDRGGGSSRQESGRQLPPNSPLELSVNGQSSSVAEDDVPQRVWDGFIEKARGGDYGRLPREVPDSARRLIDRAEREGWDNSSLLRAIDGCILFRRRRGKTGTLQFSDVFGTYPGSRPQYERIEFWIEQAESPGVSGSPTVPSERDVKINRALRDIRRAVEGTQDSEVIEDAERARTFLRENGIEWTEGDGEVRLGSG